MEVRNKQMEWSLLIMILLFIASMFLSGCAEQGNMGEPGQDGAPGIVGPPGQDSKPITIVQFCKSQGVTSPGHYPEQGLCINGSIYAVYWDGSNSFMAEVIPGTYISTSTGLQCTFTVTANCNVQ